MRTEPVVALAATFVLAAACGGDDRRPGGGPLPPGVTVTTTTTGAGAGSGAGTATGGGGAGTGGMATGGSMGPEDCADGQDNDGDGDTDCADSDCTMACASSCAAPVPLGDPAFQVPGTTIGRPDELSASCSRSGGAEVVYELTAAQTGILDVILRSSESDLSVSLRTDCASDGSEAACVDREKNPGPVEEDRQLLSAPVTAGQTVFVVVEGSGDFVFELVESRPAGVCGDAAIDPGEECDDGMAAGGGCEDDCTISETETEPNDDAAGADPFMPFWVGTIDPAGDVDFLSVSVPEQGSLTATLFDLGDGSCTTQAIDSLLAIIGPDGTTVLEEDDFGGEGSCSQVFASALAAGTYYVRVRADDNSTPIFGYELDVVVAP